ncbi:MAG: radical SAM protein, partial [Micromonosporaceae bacterium]|nr:radical SAM protein [Micromonosporaceae bacterium]
MSTLLRNPYGMPHQAVVFTGADLVNNFDVRKVAAAYRRRLREGTLGQDAAIWELEIHPTNFCNLKCPGCSYRNRHDSRTIDLGDLMSLVHHYSQFDLKSIFVSGGGDPAFWNGWGEFIERLHHPVPKLGVSTNLSSLREMTPALDRISIFQVHVVGYNRASTLEETGVDRFNAIKRNLDRLFAIRNPSQQVTMKILVRDDNYADLPMFLDFIAGYPCDSVVVKLCQDFLRNTAVL